MVGSHQIEVLIDHKEQLFASSLEFAKFDSPDFIIMKEAMLAYEKIVLYKNDGVNESDKAYLV